MSNPVSLLADDTPHPPRPGRDLPGDGPVTVAGCADRVPVFWLFCFGADDLSYYEGPEGPVPLLVAEMDKVRQRLAERDHLARDLFPAHTSLWERWGKAIESLDRHYLKADLSGAQVLYVDEDELACRISEALDWFELGNDSERAHLLDLAGIEHYDPATGTIECDEENGCPEQFLLGWLNQGP